MRCLRQSREETAMPISLPEEVEYLKRLAAWHRIQAEHAGSDWVWEARLRTAEDLEQRAADLCARTSAKECRAPVKAIHRGAVGADKTDRLPWLQGLSVKQRANTKDGRAASGKANSHSGRAAPRRAEGGE